MKYEFIKADKDLFAIYQTMYSQADIEMWYDWNKRLEDTKWTDDCFFITADGIKVGGTIITNEKVMFPFLIPPFSDRFQFWNEVIKYSQKDSIQGVQSVDERELLKFGYKVVMTGQVMCRPADTFEQCLPEGFTIRPFHIEKDLNEAGAVLVHSYKNGICDEINGAATIEETVEDMASVYEYYSEKSFSHVICEKGSNKIVGVCIAGIAENCVNHYTEIAELCVLPEYRGRGLAKYMVKKVLTDSYGTSPFVKLFVYVGNDAEKLYYYLGFIGGPQFSRMIKR